MKDPDTLEDFYTAMPDVSDMDAEEAAHTLYEYLKERAKECGQNPEVEVGLYGPDERTRESGNCWWVAWEAGPYRWAGVNNGYFLMLEGDGWYGEPYYGFDVQFVEID